MRLLLEPTDAQWLADLGDLTDKQREVFVILTTQKLTLAQAAARLGLREPTLADRWLRAQRRVRKALLPEATATREFYEDLFATISPTPSNPRTPHLNKHGTQEIPGRPKDPFLVGSAQRVVADKPVTVDDMEHPGLWREVQRDIDHRIESGNGPLMARPGHRRGKKDVTKAKRTANNVT